MAVTSGPTVTTATSPTSSRFRRNHPHHCGPVEGQVAARRKENYRARTDGQLRGLFLLPWGRQFLHRRSKTYLLLAKRMFEKAVELDPLCARAYAGIVDCDSFLFLNYNADVSIDGQSPDRTLPLPPDIACEATKPSRATHTLRRDRPLNPAPWHWSPKCQTSRCCRFFASSGRRPVLATNRT